MDSIEPVMNHFRIGKSESNVSENRPLGIDILIENTAVLLLDDDFTVVDPGWVAVSGDVIKEVGSGALQRAFVRVLKLLLTVRVQRQCLHD